MGSLAISTQHNLSFSANFKHNLFSFSHSVAQKRKISSQMGLTEKNHQAQKTKEYFDIIQTPTFLGNYLRKKIYLVNFFRIRPFLYVRLLYFLTPQSRESPFFSSPPILPLHFAKMILNLIFIFLLYIYSNQERNERNKFIYIFLESKWNLFFNLS